MNSDLDKITEIEDVDEAYNKFEEVMVNTINEHAPMKKRKSLRTHFYERCVGGPKSTDLSNN